MDTIIMIKPKIGEPCNGCGVCCQTQVCRNGAFVLGLVKNIGDTVRGECPAIVKKHDGTIACGIVLYPVKYLGKSKYRPEVQSKYFAFLIGSGNGCDELGDEPTVGEEIKLDEMLEKILASENFKKTADMAFKVIYGIT